MGIDPDEIIISQGILLDKIRISSHIDTTETFDRITSEGE